MRRPAMTMCRTGRCCIAALAYAALAAGGTMIATCSIGVYVQHWAAPFDTTLFSFALIAGVSSGLLGFWCVPVVASEHRHRTVFLERDTTESRIVAFVTALAIIFASLTTGMFLSAIECCRDQLHSLAWGVFVLTLICLATLLLLIPVVDRPMERL